MTPVWLALEQGIFQKYGLNVQLQFAESSTAVAGLISGNAQLMINDGASTISAIAQGGDIEIIGYIDKTNPYAIVSRPEITQPEQLRGAKIALLKPGDTTDISARIALTPLGIIVGQDVTAISIGNSPSRLAALLTGQVDAALLSEAFIDEAHSQGMNVLISLRDQKIPYVASALIVSKAFAQANPNTIVAYFKGVTEGVKFFSDPANKDQSMAAIAKYMNADPSSSQVSDAYTFYHASLAHDAYPDPEGVQTVLSAMKQIDPATYGNLSVEQVTDTSYASQLRTDGFLDQVWGSDH